MQNCSPPLVVSSFLRLHLLDDWNALTLPGPLRKRRRADRASLNSPGKEFSLAIRKIQSVSTAARCSCWKSLDELMSREVAAADSEAAVKSSTLFEFVARMKTACSTNVQAAGLSGAAAQDAAALR